jgi:hypothetical protein
MWLVRVTGQSLARIADAELMASAERLERLRDAEAPAEIAFTALAERIEVLTPEPRAIPRLTSGGAISSSASCAARRRPGRIVAGGRVRRPGRLHLDEPGPRRAGARHHGRPLRGDRLRADSRARGRVVQTTGARAAARAASTSSAAPTLPRITPLAVTGPWPPTKRRSPTRLHPR